MSMGFNFAIGGLNLGAGGKAEDTKGTSASATQGQAVQEHGKDAVYNELRDGDYQVIVHVIEARKLKPVDKENGTADPVVVAKLEFPSSVIAMRQNSPRKVNTLNPVWDYTMIFKQSNVAAYEGKNALLSLQVKDANWAERDVLIGSFDFNLSAVYGRKNHEYFNQWCALMDVRQETERPCGYMKVTITVLINDDEMAVHPELASQAPPRAPPPSPHAEPPRCSPPRPKPLHMRSFVRASTRRRVIARDTSPRRSSFTVWHPERLLVVHGVAPRRRSRAP